MARGAVAPGAPGLRVWFFAARPATLPAAVAPVLVGTAAATAAADLRLGAFVAALLGALLIQIATNFANDYSDFQRGLDNAARLGPTRVTQAGWATPAQMRWAIVVTLAAAGGAGLYLTVVAGWPVLVAGLAAIVAGLAYTGGPWPYGYHGLGDLFVFLFFGLVAVMGSFYVQVETLSWASLAAAIPVGLTVTAILVVNNLRDIESDRAGGKRTLAVRLGPQWSRAQYLALLGLAFALMPIFAAGQLLPWWAMQTWLALPLAALVGTRVASGTSGRALNVVLKQSGQLHLLFGVLLALGYLW